MMQTTPSFEIRQGTWNDLGRMAGALRTAVFVREQGVPPELEMDVLDPLCLHVLALGADGQAVATGRLVTEAPGIARIGRAGHKVHHGRVVSGHANAQFVLVCQKHLGFAIVLFRRKTEPLGGHFHILRHAKAVLIAAAQDDLGAGIAVRGQGLHQLQNLLVLADIVGGPGIVKLLFHLVHGLCAHSQGRKHKKRHCQKNRSKIFFHKNLLMVAAKRPRLIPDT